MHLIKIYKQSWKQLCFLLFTLCTFLLSCGINSNSGNEQRLVQFTGSSFLISYTGADEFEHGYVLDLNGMIFFHDSLYLFKENKHTDTVWLPSKKYVVVLSADGRILYDYITPLAVLMKINDNLNKDSTNYSSKAGNLLSKGELIVNFKKTGVVQFSKNYPLRIQSFSAQ